jgi:hypothetical protein
MPLSRIIANGACLTRSSPFFLDAIGASAPEVANRMFRDAMEAGRMPEWQGPGGHMCFRITQERFPWLTDLHERLVTDGWLTVVGIS